MNIPFLRPPELVRHSYADDSAGLSVVKWITLWDFQEPIDVGLIGVPLAKGGRTYAAVDAAPNALRKALAGFTTYDAQRDVDLQRLRVRHVGDAQLFATDLARSQAQAESALAALFALPVPFLPVVIGGDHSVSYAAFRAFRRTREVRTGLVYFGTQHALCSPPHAQSVKGPQSETRVAVTEQTMLRTLLDEGLIVGSDVIQLGMHGFVGSRDERNFARAQGMTVMTAAEMQRRGVGTAMIEALRRVPGMIGAIYVTVNVNVVDLPYAPVAPDAQWGGLGAADLLEAVYILGQDRRVQAFDLVGVDAYRDHLDVTVRLACTIILSFLSGINARTER